MIPSVAWRPTTNTTATGFGQRPMNDDVADLIEQSLAGDDQAFERLVLSFQNKVYTLIARMVRNRDTALDLAQEVFLKIYRKLGDLKDKGRASSWIMQVAHNTTLDYIKKRRLEAVSTDFDDQATQQRMARFISTPSDEAPEAVIERLTPSEMDELVDELDVKYRTILTLRFVEGYPFQDIAEILGLPLSTVKFRKHYAIKLLQQKWLARYGQYR